MNYLCRQPIVEVAWFDEWRMGVFLEDDCGLPEFESSNLELQSDSNVRCAMLTPCHYETLPETACRIRLSVEMV